MPTVKYSYSPHFPIFPFPLFSHVFSPISFSFVCECELLQWYAISNAVFNYSQKPFDFIFPEAEDFLALD